MKRAVLTDVQIRKTKPKEKRYMLTDGRGLVLEVMTTGLKYWRLIYRVDGKRKMATLGEYPAVTLVDARQKAEELRQELTNGRMPADVLNPPKTPTFHDIAEEWRIKQEPHWVASYAEKIRCRLEKHIYPFLGNRPMNDIKTSELLAILRPLEASGKRDTAKRVRQIYSQIARYGMAIEVCDADVSLPLVDALSAPKVKHYAAFTQPEDIKRLLFAMSAYTGSPIVKAAMWISLYTLCRPGEIRHAEWSEVDLGNAIWEIPAEKMKKRKPHAVPLSSQAVEILKELQPLTKRWGWVFPSARNDGRPMSENAVRAALRSMGFTNDEMTAHGFRSLGSTMLNSLGYKPDVIEAALAHIQPGVRGVYNRGDYWDDRITMMQAWADYLDTLMKN